MTGKNKTYNPMLRHGTLAGALTVLALMAVMGILACGQREQDEKTPAAGKSGIDGPVRIVSLAPSITETLFSLGLGDRVAGVTRFCAWPEEARAKPRVGGFLDTNFEAVAALRPDMVILLPEHGQAIKYLDTLGIRYTVVTNKTLGDMLNTITAIGALCGIEGRADSLRSALTARMEAVRRKAENHSRRTVLISVSRTTGTGDILDVTAAGTGTLYDEMIDCAGGVNVCRTSIPYPTLSPEGIIRLNPDVIIDLAPETTAGTPEAATLLSDWKALGSLDAVRAGRVHCVTANYAVVPGPRIVDFLEDLAEIIHGEGLSGGK